MKKGFKMNGFMSKVNMSLKNAWFWTKYNMFVRPTNWIDSKTSDSMGYFLYKFFKMLSKGFWLIVFPVTLIVFASMSAVFLSTNTFEFSGYFALSGYVTTVCVMVAAGIFTFLAMWFKRYKNFSPENIATAQAKTAAIKTAELEAKKLEKQKTQELKAKTKEQKVKASKTVTSKSKSSKKKVKGASK